MDSLGTFITKLESELDTLEKGSLTPTVKYREIPNWSSMFALIIIAFCETEYSVTITGEDLRSCETVTDLYGLVVSRSK
ncbi:MAG: acyl carrier protein [Bacteroidia bacterium]|nr:acyl carrier protein [Bacteroidia bacterium]